MDHFPHNPHGHPPEETTNQEPNTDPFYPVNGDTLFQTHFGGHNPVQNSTPTPSTEAQWDDDTKEYIPTTGSNGVPPNFYSGFPSQTDPSPSTTFQGSARELPPEHYPSPEHLSESYLPTQEETRQLPPNGEFNQQGMDPAQRTVFYPPTSNVMQGTPPVASSGNYVSPPAHTVSPSYPTQPPYTGQTPYVGQQPIPNTPPLPPTQTTPSATSPIRESGIIEENVPFPVTPFPTGLNGGLPVPNPNTGDFPVAPPPFHTPPEQVTPATTGSLGTAYMKEATPDTVLLIWKKVLEILKGSISSVGMDAWFYKESSHDIGTPTHQPVLPVSFQGNVFTLMTSDELVKEMFEQSFAADVSKVLFALFNYHINVVIKLNHSYEVFEEAKQENYNLDYTFENFIESKDNETAYQFAKRIAESETVEFNPFFIYGQSGLGKTHLVCAIANAKKIQMEQKRKIQFEQTGYVGKNFKITYTTGLEWIQEWIHAIQSKNTRSFKEKYEDCDLFILDDVQFLAQRDNTQEELFNLFDNMIRYKRQVVFTSDCHPSKLNGFHDRLTTRFAQGLSQEVKFPDLETCIAITRSKAEQKGLKLPDSIIELIAENTKSSVREIEGMVNKVFAKCDMSSDSVLDKETIMSLVKDIVVDNKESGPTPRDFIRSVSSYFDVNESDLIAHGRTKQIVRPRNIAIFIIRENTDLALKEIGDLFSGRDHSTIKNSLTNVENILKKEAKAGTETTKAEIADIIQRAKTLSAE